MERITSSHNPLVQHMRKLQTSRAYRESCGEFVADGWKLLEEALKWYPEVTAVLTSEPERCPALPSSARLVEVPASLMQSVSSMRTPQGVLFSLRLPQEGALRVQPGMLLLDRIQDPGNLGTILRTADAFDLPVLLTNGCADPFSERRCAPPWARCSAARRRAHRWRTSSVSAMPPGSPLRRRRCPTRRAICARSI